MDLSGLDLDTWKTFFEENWLVLAAGLVVLLLVIGIVKTVAKWALAAVIVIGLVLYSGYNLQDLRDLGDKVRDQAVTAMAGEAAEAVYKDNGDGTYTVTTRNLELTGAKGEDKVDVAFKGAPLGSWSIDGTIRALIEGAKRGG
ncbi:hypothetical protein HGI30_18160 [Paenibacillus albicereus]|uniref:Uncharacterized protein n=1 Tax=Paenibacillus albicereus TaxID=2726185 RepID=A0A6H2H0U5_9BACL|nr:hypothetical protein [Paenibacillus albicereus]QJC53311.1 hypothetical protein HGI30_18160 [Paenibacillus albicereus]